MSTAAKFRLIVSGQRSGLFGALARGALALAEIPYRAAVQWRNGRYNRGQGIERVDVPVVSVGNLTLGGTGKTPMVEWLARWFAERGVRVALVSRGYGSRGGRPNDEALELSLSLPQVPHTQDRDRVQAARQAMGQFGAQAIILDDGFQHRRLARDLDIVLVDALEPFGFGHVFPRGTLREPLAGWGRAQAIALARSDLVDAQQRDRIRQEVAHYAPQAAWLELVTRSTGLLAHSGARQDVASLCGKSIAAFCGIGNPAGFRRQLENCGYRIGAWREYADHQAYGPAEIQNLAAWVAGQQADAVICTRKDLVKIPHDRLGTLPLWALAVEQQVAAGREALDALLNPLAARASASRPFR